MKNTTVESTKLLLAVLLITSVSVACAPMSEQNSTTQFENTEGAIRDTASLETQIQRLTRDLSFNPRDIEILYERSLLFYENGNTASAVTDIATALEIAQDDPKLWHLFGFYAYIQNRNEASLSHFKKAAEMGSENPETYYQIGQIYFFKGEYKEAEKWYTTAGDLDPEDPTYDFAMGFMYQKMGNIDRAIQLYNNSLDKNPQFVKSLAQLYSLNNEVFKNADKAKEYNARILEADSLHPIGRFNQGNTYYNEAMTITDMKEEARFEHLLRLAVSEYSRSVLVDANFTQAFYNRGYCFFMLDKYEEAMSDFDQVLEQDPYNEKAFFMRGSIHEYFGDFASARSNYMEALRLNPAFKDAEVAINEMDSKLGKK